jgi:hypothetical protein
MGIFGGKPATPTQTPVKDVVDVVDTTTVNSAAEEDRKKRALLAINAGGASGLGVSGSANVTKRNLLGL